MAKQMSTMSASAMASLLLILLLLPVALPAAAAQCVKIYAIVNHNPTNSWEFTLH